MVPSILFTGHPDTIKEGSCDSLIVKAGPIYDRTSSFTRIVSWLKYSYKALFLCLFSNRKTLLFFVPFSPLLRIIAYICKKLKDQHYVVLVYDIYPDLRARLIERGKNRIAMFSKSRDEIVLDAIKELERIN